MNVEPIYKMARLYASVVPWSDNMLSPYPFHQGYHVMEDNKLVALTEDTYQAFVTRNTERMIEYSKKGDDPLGSLFMFMSKPYRLEFLDLCKDMIPVEQIGKLLSWIWTATEFPNLNGVSRWIKLFQMVDKSTLMNEEELQGYNALPDEVVAYRGILTGKGKARAMSWTLSKEKAEWFAGRWGHGGQVYSAKVKKQNIFAYFTGRGEDEIVVNSRKLLEVVLVYNVDKKPDGDLK